MLNPNIVSCRIFSEKLDEMSNVIGFENELSISAEFMSRSKIEQIDKYIVHMLQKSRRKLE